MTITVIGTPAPQGSKRFVGLAKSGRGIMIESSKAVKPWREAVVWAVREALNSENGVFGPVEVRMTFTIKKPASAPKRIRSWPDKKPDCSKLVRSTEDALVTAGAIEDDARIVRLVASKVFPGEGVDALNVPGAVIHITAVEA